MTIEIFSDNFRSTSKLTDLPSFLKKPLRENNQETAPSLKFNYGEKNSYIDKSGIPSEHNEKSSKRKQAKKIGANIFLDEKLENIKLINQLAAMKQENERTAQKMKDLD